MTSKAIWTMAVATVAGMALVLVGTGCNGAGNAAAYEAFAKQAGAPTIRVPVVGAVKIDGELDEAYQKADPKKFMFLAGGASKPTAETTVYVVSTKKDLVVFFDCRTADPSSLQGHTRDRDVGIWGEDYIELFLNASGTRTGEFVQIGVNPVGAVWDGKLAGDGTGDAVWNCNCKAKAKVGKKGWTVELAIPLAEVAGGEKINKVWVANFGRMAQLEGEDIAWCSTNSSRSFVPGKFGYLWLDVGTVDNSK